MTDDEIGAYLHLPGQVLNLATIQRTGVPHLTALFYGFTDDDRIGILTYESSQKVVNLRRDPRFSALIETGDKYAELCGVHLTGTIELRNEFSFKEGLMSSTSSRYPQGPLDDSPATRRRVLDKRVALVLNVGKYHSWDHRKLGGTY